MRRAVLACALCAASVAVAADAGAQASRWQCSSTGARTLAPALAEAAGEYLARVEAIYPHQVLGLVRAGDRFYLLNSIDMEWTERTRLNLLTLRLRESYLTAERQATHATPGSSPPPGGFVCLAPARAAREGVTRTPLGEIVLAAGQSVHLVDPQEPEVTVEVRAAQNRSLNLGEIFIRSSRTGIYAGLTGQMSGHAGEARGPATGQPQDGTLIIRMASAGGSAAETRFEVPDWAAVAGMERQAENMAAIDPRHEEITIQPAPVPERKPASVIAATSQGTAAPAAQSSTGQTYEEYAKAMKTLLAARRTGAVRSISELTYVHPAVEVIRTRLR